MSACGDCGHDPACGQAEIDGTPYCHGDCPHEPDSVSCYTRANLTAALHAAAADLIAMLDNPKETRLIGDSP